MRVNEDRGQTWIEQINSNISNNSNIASREENLSAVASLALAHSQLAPRSDTRREVELLRLWNGAFVAASQTPHQWIDRS
jgi:hypothetical protein